jgi:hypothetical protein
LQVRKDREHPPGAEADGDGGEARAGGTVLRRVGEVAAVAE